MTDYVYTVHHKTNRSALTYKKWCNSPRGSNITMTVIVQLSFHFNNSVFLYDLYSKLYLFLVPYKIPADLH